MFDRALHRLTVGLAMAALAFGVAADRRLSAFQPLGCAQPFPFDRQALALPGAEYHGAAGVRIARLTGVQWKPEVPHFTDPGWQIARRKKTLFHAGGWALYRGGQIPGIGQITALGLVQGVGPFLMVLPENGQESDVYAGQGFVKLLAWVVKSQAVSVSEAIQKKDTKSPPAGWVLVDCASECDCDQWVNFGKILWVEGIGVVQVKIPPQSVGTSPNFRVQLADGSGPYRDLLLPKFVYRPPEDSANPLPDTTPNEGEESMRRSA